MNTAELKAQFDLAEFQRLSGDGLREYLNSLDARPDGSWISDTDAAELDSSDAEHTVYALLLVGRYAPPGFVARLPGLLIHPIQSVRLAAWNLLDELPASHITLELIVAVRDILNAALNGAVWANCPPNSRPVRPLTDLP